MEKFNFKSYDFLKYQELAIDYSIKLSIAIAIFIIGSWIVKKIVKIIEKTMTKGKMERSLQKFLSDLIKWSLKALLFITVLSQLGIATSSFITLIGAAGLALGLALQGSLANFAGGALILLFKPFKVGDLIDAQGELGEVQEIRVFVTKLLTPGNKVAIIPNGILSNGTIKNYSQEGKLRVDLTIGISYGSDIKKAKEILEKTRASNPKVLRNPAPLVGVLELADSAVNLAVRPWATPENYWNVYFESLEACKNALDKENINIPFPQRVVHMQHN